VITLDRDQTIALWRRAEAKVYPAVMVNEALYKQYVALVRAVADELADIDNEDDLVTAWRERHEVALEAVARLAPSMQPLMDLEAVRAAAFCQRHREVTREHGKRIARERLLEARRTGADWVVLFDDVTPFGSHRLEMHVQSGRAVHSSSELALDAPAPKYELEVVQLDPEDGAWLLDRAPLMPPVQYPTHEEWEVRIGQAKETFSKRG
jgi:hypothetical protein